MATFTLGLKHTQDGAVGLIHEELAAALGDGALVGRGAAHPPGEVLGVAAEALGKKRGGGGGLGLGDADGVTQLRGLNQTIYAALAHKSEQARLAAEEAKLLEASLESLLETAQSPHERVMALIRKANQAADLHTPDVPLARRAVAEADALSDGIREQVLARLCLARACPEEAERCLADARDRADEADEPNLVGAVASAARAMGVRLAERVF